MGKLKFISKSIRYYKREHILVLIGVIISTAVLAGALMIGDSVKYSLQDIVNKRLGETHQILQTQGRYFPSNLSQRMSEKNDLDVAALLILKGIASVDNNEFRLPDVQIIGMDESFQNFTNETFTKLNENEIIINEKIAEDLHLSLNDDILIRIEKAGFVSLNAPFVLDEDNTVSARMKIKAIVSADDFGNFNLKTDQITPYNIFISQVVLSGLFFNKSYANTLLIKQNKLNRNELNSALTEVWTINDLNLHFRDIDDLNKIELVSDRIFIENKIIDVLKTSLYKPNRVFSYLVNFMRANEKETPYSFVAALEDTSIYKLKDNEIIINDWTANDLNAQIGDSIELEYYTVGSLRKLNEEKRFFIIKNIVPISGFAADSMLMPAFEGLADVDHCSDWEAGIPMDYSKIRDKDEVYWDIYRGTPKAFISYTTAKEIWKNTQGDFTALRFDIGTSVEEISKHILTEIKPEDLGFQIYNVKEESLWSANNAVDFAQLFLGLSFFLILAAFILTGLLFSILLNSRKKEQGILISLGIPQKKIKNLFLYEGILIAMIGSFLGLFAGILLNKIVLYFLNSIWYDIVRTSSISLHIKPLTLIFAFIINILTAAFVIWLTIRRRMKQNINELNKGIIKQNEKKKNSDIIIFIISLLIFGSLMVWSLVSGIFQNSSIFFLNGFILLAMLISGASVWIRKRSEKNSKNISPRSLAAQNMVFSRKRNLSTVLILSIGVFIVISTGMNRTDFHRNAESKKSGTGSYTFFAETNIPINADLNSLEGLSKFGLEQIHDSVSFVQFSAVNGDDASCLNLNRILRPRIIGFDPDKFIEREAFTFVKLIEETENPWDLLNMKLDENCIPAIADQTVIKWGLGKAVGDSISYINEQGDTIHLVLAGGLANSVFQGNMLISQKNFKDHFPSIAGSKVFLVDNKTESKTKLKDDLLTAFRNYGIKIDEAPERLEMFNSVTNTYLDIFLALGGIALIIGTFGVAVVLVRSINEQKHIFAMMQAIGIKRKQIRTIIRAEHIAVLMTGLFIGVSAAFTASLPAILSDNLQIPFGLLFGIIVVFISNGLLWIILGTKLSLKKGFIEQLRNE